MVATIVMPIRFACEHCGQKLSVSSRKAGVTAKCPQCKQRITVPEKTSAKSGAPPIESEDEPEPPEGADDPYAQFVVYDDDVEWVYEDDATAVIAPRADDIDLSKIAVPRGILYAQGVLLGVVAVVAFVFGVLIGGGGASSDVAQRPPQPCTILGQVYYESNERANIPDEGTVVIVLPQDQKPGADRRPPIEGLRPTDPPPNDQNAGIRAIRMLGGDYTRADANGAFRLRVPDAGKYYVLVVSRNKYRTEGDDPVRADLAQLGGYFLPATDLLGDSKYQWSSVNIRRDHELDVTF